MHFYVVFKPPRRIFRGAAADVKVGDDVNVDVAAGYKLTLKWCNCKKHTFWWWQLNKKKTNASSIYSDVSLYIKRSQLSNDTKKKLASHDGKNTHGFISQLEKTKAKWRRRKKVFFLHSRTEQKSFKSDWRGLKRFKVHGMKKKKAEKSFLQILGEVQQGKREEICITA